MGRGRKPKWESEEERLQAIKDSKMKYYKKNRVEILEKRKESNPLPAGQTTKPNITVYGSASDEIEEDVTFEAFDDESTSHYQSKF